MDFSNPYCLFVLNKASDNVHKLYHDSAYGFPIQHDNEIFGRLILEINQAGLSWETILKKESHFKDAYYNYDINRIANFNAKDVEILLSNKGIIRNKLKINATIHNAQVVQKLQQEFGSFKNWLDSKNYKDLKNWVQLFKKTFKFTGGEITKEFLVSLGYLEGAHSIDCPIYTQVLKHHPKWLSLKG